MSKRIYVGNLPFSVTLEQLKATFGKYGEVEEATVVTNKFSGRSKGFGFVTFKNDEDAEKAKAELNGKDFEGRPLQVNDAAPFDPDKPRPKRDFGDRNGGGRGRGFGGPRRFDRRERSDNRDFQED